MRSQHKSKKEVWILTPHTNVTLSSFSFHLAPLNFSVKRNTDFFLCILPWILLFVVFLTHHSVKDLNSDLKFRPLRNIWSQKYFFSDLKHFPYLQVAYLAHLNASLIHSLTKCNHCTNKGQHAASLSTLHHTWKITLILDSLQSTVAALKQIINSGSVDLASL